MELLFKEEFYRIMGACFEVYKGKGARFGEAVYGLLVNSGHYPQLEYEIVR